MSVSILSGYNEMIFVFALSHLALLVSWPASSPECVFISPFFISVSFLPAVAVFSVDSGAPTVLLVWFRMGLFPLCFNVRYTRVFPLARMVAFAGRTVCASLVAFCVPFPLCPHGRLRWLYCAWFFAWS